jgi:preprotein translocase subunit YajC
MKFDDNDDRRYIFLNPQKKQQISLVVASHPIFGWFSFMLNPNTKSQREGAAKMLSQLPQGGAPVR